jgi:hypothetical protein
MSRKLRLRVARNLDVANGRTLGNSYYENVAIGREAHVPEEPGCKQRFDGSARCVGVDAVPDFGGEVAKYGPGIDPLSPLDPDVPDGEGLKSQSAPSTQQAHHNECRAHPQTSESVHTIRRAALVQLRESSQNHLQDPISRTMSLNRATPMRSTTNDMPIF